MTRMGAADAAAFRREYGYAPPVPAKTKPTEVDHKARKHGFHLPHFGPRGTHHR